MADIAVTAANVRASVYARRLTLTPTHVLVGGSPSLGAGWPLEQVPNLPIAGETITAGQPVYQAADDLFYLADANGAAPLYEVAGIAENSASANQPISIVEEDPEFTPGCTMLVGDTIILSGTPGRICPDSDKTGGVFVATLMVAYSTTQARLKISRSDVAKA